MPFELIFFLHQCNKMYRLTYKRLLLWCYSPCTVYFSPKNAWSYFEKKNWYRFCRSFHISCTLSFRTAHGNRWTWTLLSCSVYFVRVPLPFELIFLHQCNKIYRLTYKRLLLWCYSPCSEDSEKDSCSNKIKTTCYNWFLLFAAHAGIEKDT